MASFRTIAATSIIFLGTFQDSVSMAREPDEIIKAINAHLKRFAEHPSEVMNEAPERRDALNKPIAPGTDLRFSPAAIESGDALKAKDADRAQMCMAVNGEEKCLATNVVPPRSGIQGNDRPEDLVDGHELIRSLKILDSKGLRSAKLSISPWSDDYWGLYKGMLGARYADPNFPANWQGNIGNDWNKNYTYVLHHPASQIIASHDAAQVNLLSPSEKYEMLVGDSDAHLTSLMWDEGRKWYDSTGYVETWIGICDGWSSAAMMLPRPQKMLNLRTADGQTWLQFYPSDAKALASFLWARGMPAIRFIGGRCNDKNPTTDRYGRIISQDCFDTNPGTWHLAVTNQLGIAHRSFLVDTSYDYEIWNQPAFSYQYWYFNPLTVKYVDTVEEARVPMAKFTTDDFGRYRSPNSVAVVGVAMDFTYVLETRPGHEQSDSPVNDALRTVRYYYDLELDASDNIIGGEWYNNRHPDFIWVPVPGSQAASIAENEATGIWNGPDRAMPESWRKAAIHASKTGQPLGKIVEQILLWAR